MANYFDEQITKYVDWGGDNSTNGLPVTGRRVQEFIKNTLESKAGYFYYDNTANRYLVFSDEESKNIYLDNPIDSNNQKLILATFDAPFNYNASIVLNTPFYNAIPLNKKGNYINFTFDITNKSGQPTGESVTCTYTFVRGSIKKVVTEVYRAGQVVNFNIDNYLLEGNNAISVTITGQTSLAATTVGLTFNVVDLSLTDDFDISTVVRTHEDVDTLEVPYTIKGQGTKLMEWYIDGVKQEFVKDEDQIVSTVEETRTKTLLITGLSSGIHSVQFRAVTNISGENFYTETLYREFIVHNGESVNGVVVTACNIPQTFGIVNTENPLIFRGITQYNPYNLQVAGFNTKGLELSTEIFIGSTKLGSINISNGVTYSLPINVKDFGESTLRFVIDELNQREISVVIEKTTMNISEINDALQFNFNAVGKTNTSTDKESWSYGDYTATLLGFPWNEAGGWVNNRLKLGEGCSIEFTYAPLISDACVSGRTIELEFNSFNVSDDNEVLCDLRNENGTGLLITASEISLRSRGGAEISTSYKSDENIRVALVINRRNGATNKRLVFIYINGIISGAVPYTETDDFISGKLLKFVGTANAGVMIKNIRIYDNALSSDNILNNYIIYQDSIDDMRTIYDRNDIYNTEGTAFDPNLMVNALPVMIVTGELSTLENTTDKDTQIIVDIQYTNLQDPTKSFTMTNAAMRPQGTSSMNYPKKNFRIYTQKVEETELRDYKGSIIENKLYAFKEGSQPVNCWCLKADFAESSGTHNTGIARLWNKVLYNAQIDGLYRLRTTAQQKAIDNSYPFDVRTTIDGFPILLFYRKDYDSDLIFIGKYNFNNDKSTESVFGFTGIEGFDNSRMQCWEVLNNETPLALFTDVSDFDGSWSESFESRYPDTKTPRTTDLKNFALWMNSMSGKHEQFATEKWDHFDVYKVAAYYVYITRFAAVDQTVKNSMFTSEDGQHFYFINYDNDTINGLINTGRLSVEPDVTRKSLDSTGKPIYAGYNSVLWNMLEADDEFMDIVQTVDRVLSTTGLSYNEVIDMFDNQQAGKWCERVYNQDAQYKYIGPYVNNGTDNLFMMQGSRTSHRKHWLYRRFAIYDSKFVTGLYRAQSIYFKNNAAPADIKFTITAGTPLYYGYAINNILAQTGVYLEKGESYNFSAVRETTVGDPFTIFGAPNIKSLDISNFAPYLFDVVDLGKVNLPLLKTLKIGKSDVVNESLPTLSGLSVATALEELDVTNMSMFKSLELTNQINFKTLHAKGTSLTSLFLTKGSPVEYLDLPDTMQSLIFENLTKLKFSGLLLSDNTNVSNIKITGSPYLSNDFNYIYNWLTTKVTDDKNCSLVMDSIKWVDVDPAKLIELGKLGNLSLKGEITITATEDYDLYSEQIVQLREIYGENVFSKESELYIKAPASIILLGRTEILEGESEQYEVLIFGGELKNVVYSISGTGVSISQEGILTTGYTNSTRTVTMTALAFYTTDEGVVSSMSKVVNIKILARTYPTASNSYIEGSNNISENNVYKLGCSVEYTGEIRGEWELSGDILANAEIQEQSDTQCIIKIKENAILAYGTIKYVGYRKYDNYKLFTITKEIILSDDTVAEIDPGVVAAFKAAYPTLIANDSYITKEEALLFTGDMLNPNSSSSGSIFRSFSNTLITFDGLKHFKNIIHIPPYTFSSLNRLKSISLDNILSIGQDAFYSCSGLTSIILPDGVTSIGGSAFYSCYSLTSVTIPDSVTEIGQRAFYGCSKLTSITIGNGVTSFGSSVFQNCSKLAEFKGELASADGRCLIVDGELKFFAPAGLTEYTIPDGVTSIGEWAFQDGTSLTSITIPNSVTTIRYAAFWGCSKLTSIILSDRVTSIGQSAFSSCSKITNITIPDSVTSIGDSAFSNCTNLVSIILPDGITSIESNTFSNCTSLASVTIGNNVKLIASQAFNNCTSLTSINIPVSVTSIGGSVFNGCKNLTEFTGKFASNDGRCLIIDGVLKYSAHAGLSEYNIPDNVTSIGEWAFQDGTSLTSITIPNSVTSIGRYAFARCSLLVSVTIPYGVTTIGDSVFISCTSLTSITIPDSVTKIGNSPFWGCSSLTSVTIGNRVNSIGAEAFSGCVNLKTLTIKKSTAPQLANSNHFGYNTKNWTGINSAGENILYVPSGATGYEEGQWLDPLCNPDKCGFTLSKTL